MSENKKIIGLITEDVFTDFAKDLVESARKAIPENKGIRLAVISGKRVTLEKEDTDEGMYNEVYNSIYRFSEYCGLDGLIIHPGAMNAGKLAMIEKTTQGRLGKIPKIIISSALEGFTTVGYDNTTGIRQALEYIINVDSITNICMLGGREDNHEAVVRKHTFIESLRSHGIMFRSRMFEPTDMWENTDAAAERLLDRNPGVRAIFCVNDSVAVGLYRVLYKRGLIPGRDIMVFGFDNTRMAGGMKPSLASVGAEGVTLGQRAVEMLLDKMNGEEVQSELIRTRIFGRGSFDCMTFDISVQDLIKADAALIYRMFDDCFYRYRNDIIDREDVDLKRLFYEIISRMLKAMNDRYLSLEDFGDIGRLIDIFFNEGAMEYTDSEKLLNSINRLQNTMAAAQKMHSVTINSYINRLFLRMKDRAISVLSDKFQSVNGSWSVSMKNMRDFLVETISYDGGRGVRGLFANFATLGISNAAVYLFDEKVIFSSDHPVALPDHIHPICVMKNGELYMMSDERRSCPLNEVLTRRDLSSKCKGYAMFPVFCRDRIYGIFMGELEGDVCASGELIALQLGRMLYIDSVRRE